MKVTTDLLRQWNACADGYGWFIRKFPQGADYGLVQQALREDNRFSDSAWLTERAYATLLDDTFITKEIAADAKAASDEVIKETAAIPVDAAKVYGNVTSDEGGDSAQIGSSGNDARIGSSGYGARIGSSGYGARIGSSGEYARIGSSGYGARIGSSGNDAQIGSSGDGARIVADGDNAVIACAGLNARIKVGIGASVAVPYKDATGHARFAVGYEGENLKRGVWYQVNSAGRFEEVETGIVAGVSENSQAA